MVGLNSILEMQHKYKIKMNMSVYETSIAITYPVRFIFWDLGAIIQAEVQQCSLSVFIK